MSTKLAAAKRQKLKKMKLWNSDPFDFLHLLFFLLSTIIYDLVLIYVCHFHHHLLHLTVSQITALSRYSCLYLGSLHPRILRSEKIIFYRLWKVLLQVIFLPFCGRFVQSEASVFGGHTGRHFEDQATSVHEIKRFESDYNSTFTGGIVGIC